MKLSSQDINPAILAEISLPHPHTGRKPLHFLDYSPSTAQIAEVNQRFSRLVDRLTTEA